MFKRLSFFIVLTMIWSCSSEPKCGDPDAFINAQIELEFQDLTHAFHEIKSEEDLRLLFSQNPIIRDEFFEYGGRLSKEDLHSEIFKLIQTPKVKKLFEPSDFDSFEGALDESREMREFLTFEYLTINKDKTLFDIYNMLQNSEISKLNNSQEISDYLNQNVKEKRSF